MIPDLPGTKALHSVPQTLHLVWLGGDLPQWAYRSAQTWVEQMPGHWRIQLWTDREVDAVRTLAQIRADAEKSGLSLRSQADLIRIAAVYLFGGVYVDLDTVPLRTFDLDRSGPWIGGKPEGENRTQINAHFGFPAGNGFLLDLWDYAQSAIERKVTNDHFVAGPRAWAKVRDTSEFKPEIVPTFPTIENADLPRRFALAEEFDLDELRDRYPDATLLHIIYSRKHAK